MTKKARLKRDISMFSLIMTGLAATIGSGWLIGTQKLANVVGPASILSWIIGALIVLVVALFYVEIGSAFPSAGGIGYYSHVTHGRFCGFLTSWINWLSISAVAPIEAQSIIQYASQLHPLFLGLYDPETHHLTPLGIGSAVGLMFLFMLINYWSVRLFIRFNNIFTFIKIAVPLVTIICLFYHGLHKENFGANLQTFMPYGYPSIFTGIVGAGVVMSFNGFQSPLTFSEEVKNPRKMLPIAVILSILIALVLYVFLQVAFIGKIDPSFLVAGWSYINFRSPYVDLLMLANFQIMVTVLYFGAITSPAISGTAFLASSSRIMYSLSQEKHLPAFLKKIHPHHHNPRNAIIVSTLIGCVYLFLFKGWYSLVAVISVLHIFSYVAAPIITIANRRQHPAILDHQDQFKLKGASVLAPILLFALSVLLFYAQWPLTGEILVLIIPGLFFFFYYDYKYFKHEKFFAKFKGASWLVLYIFGISLITYLGNNPDGNLISLRISIFLLLFLSLLTYVYGAFFAACKHQEPS